MIPTTAKLKIVINVPDAENKVWKLSFIKNGVGGSPFRRKTSVSSYRLLEKKLVAFLASQPIPKTCVKVDYGHGYINEGIDTFDIAEILYSTACFLEDYLPPRFLAGRYKKYTPYV